MVPQLYLILAKLCYILAGRLSPMDHNTTSVAIRQRPRANNPSGTGRSGPLPTLPSPATINVPLSNSKMIKNSSTSNFDSSVPPTSSASIDNGHSRAPSHPSTNPFSQSSACGPSNSVQPQHSSEIISSNPFVASSHTG